jgi:hypothetical protein
MNAFVEHHQDNIRFRYRCFDRLLLNGAIQPFQQPERVLGFFWTYRRLYPVTRDVLRDIAAQYHHWVTRQSQQWRVPIVKAPEEEKREVFVTPYFRRAHADRVVAILKGREPARILIAIGTKAANRWHLELKQRWVDQYNFYINDAEWGRMFVRVCPYFPFSTRICLNQHHWIARRLERQGIRFRQCANAFLACADPDALQAVADALTAEDVTRCGQKWLPRLTPFFTKAEREHAGCPHRLFVAQAEFCDNLVFRQRAALDALEERLLDANRTIGRPTSLSVVFGRKITRYHRGKLQTVIEDLDLPNPVMRTHYQSGILKQYVRDRYLLRTEPASNNVYRDYGIPKAVVNLPRLRTKMQAIAESYLNVQQDILETFVDRGQLQHLREPTVLPNGKRIPGLKLDHPRQLAVMQALVRFSHIAAASTFTTKEVHAQAAEALGLTTTDYKLGSFRYDLSKLRAKGLVEKLPHSRRYRLLPEGYKISVVYLKLFERLYAPLTAGILEPCPGDDRLASERITRLDRLYCAVVTALDHLVDAVGLKAA